VVEVPCSCFESWTLAASEAVFALGVGVLGEGLFGAVGAFAAFVVEVFLVADHGWGCGLGWEECGRRYSIWLIDCWMSRVVDQIFSGVVGLLEGSMVVSIWRIWSFEWKILVL
jgi:hypothetical protein